MPTLICDCNQTMPLQPRALGEALHENLTLHSALCRREAGAFQKAIPSGEDFSREPEALSENFDLVMDLRVTSAFIQHALPQGYFCLPARQREGRETQNFAGNPLARPVAVSTAAKNNDFSPEFRSITLSSNT